MLRIIWIKIISHLLHLERPLMNEDVLLEMLKENIFYIHSLNQTILL